MTAKEFIHDDITEKTLQSAFAVSNKLGCGFLEKVYEKALVIELGKQGLKVSQQVPVRVLYDGETVGDYIADLVVENTVLVEVKATIDNHPVYVAQTLNYLKATGLPVALLLNFGQPKLMYRRLVLTQ